MIKLFQSGDVDFLVATDAIGMGLNLDEQKAVDRFRKNVVEPSMSKLVVLDFWAEWCGPCRMIAPAVDELASEYQEKGLKVGKLNVDHNPATSARFGVRSIPAVLFFKDGELVDQVIGAGPKAMYENKVLEHL